ncbi:hypothetical protein L323_00300 [Ruminiclostridium papyrosolvens C7]|uniref:Uncharacterized protein n=1 Tax=Ruminiclostridium papyrosolvens C7 TaxID=1330534 RepID=U4R7D5_9FIRM|nr:hypothetical protein L323_00300 [Ruminiclostridium papyrosolvens C7]
MVINNFFIGYPPEFIVPNFKTNGYVRLYFWKKSRTAKILV